MTSYSHRAVYQMEYQVEVRYWQPIADSQHWQKQTLAPDKKLAFPSRSIIVTGGNSQNYDFGPDART